MRTYITRGQRDELLAAFEALAEENPRAAVVVDKVVGALSEAWFRRADVSVSISEEPDRLAFHELIQMMTQAGIYDTLAYCPDDLRKAYTFAAEAPEAVLRTICERAADRLSDNAVASSAWRAALDAAVEKAGYPTDRADAGEGCDE